MQKFNAFLNPNADKVEEIKSLINKGEAAFQPADADRISTIYNSLGTQKKAFILGTGLIQLAGFQQNMKALDALRKTLALSPEELAIELSKKHEGRELNSCMLQYFLNHPDSDSIPNLALQYARSFASSERVIAKTTFFDRKGREYLQMQQYRRDRRDQGWEYTLDNDFLKMNKQVHYEAFALFSQDREHLFTSQTLAAIGTMTPTQRQKLTQMLRCSQNMQSFCLAFLQTLINDETLLDTKNPAQMKGALFILQYALSFQNNYIAPFTFFNKLASFGAEKTFDACVAQLPAMIDTLFEKAQILDHLADPENIKGLENFLPAGLAGDDKAPLTKPDKTGNTIWHKLAGQGNTLAFNAIATHNKLGKTLFHEGIFKLNHEDKLPIHLASGATRRLLIAAIAEEYSTRAVNIFVNRPIVNRKHLTTLAPLLDSCEDVLEACRALAKAGYHGEARKLAAAFEGKHDIFHQLAQSGDYATLALLSLLFTLDNNTPLLKCDSQGRLPAHCAQGETRIQILKLMAQRYPKHVNALTTIGELSFDGNASRFQPFSEAVEILAIAETLTQERQTEEHSAALTLLMQAFPQTLIDAYRNNQASPALVKQMQENKLIVSFNNKQSSQDCQALLDALNVIAQGNTPTAFQRTANGLMLNAEADVSHLYMFAVAQQAHPAVIQFIQRENPDLHALLGQYNALGWAAKHLIANPNEESTQLFENVLTDYFIKGEAAALRIKNFDHEHTQSLFEYACNHEVLFYALDKVLLANNKTIADIASEEDHMLIETMLEQAGITRQEEINAFTFLKGTLELENPDVKQINYFLQESLKNAEHHKQYRTELLENIETYSDEVVQILYQHGCFDDLSDAELSVMSNLIKTDKPSIDALSHFLRESSKNAEAHAQYRLEILGRLKTYAPDVRAFLRESEHFTNLLNTEFDMLAANNNIEDFVFFARDSNAAFELFYEDDNTVLHLACREGGHEQAIIDICQKSPWLINKPNANGQTPYDIFIESSRAVKGKGKGKTALPRQFNEALQALSKDVNALMAQYANNADLCSRIFDESMTAGEHVGKKASPSTPTAPPPPPQEEQPPEYEPSPDYNPEFDATVARPLRFAPATTKAEDLRAYRDALLEKLARVEAELEDTESNSRKYSM